MLETTSVGSFPKPDYLQKARTAFSLNKISHQQLVDLELQATREIIALQEEIGIDILVHGEMERGDMTTYFAEKLDGMGSAIWFVHMAIAIIANRLSPVR